MPQIRKFKCYDCGIVWDEQYGTGRPQKCLKCGSMNIQRAENDRGYARTTRCGRGVPRGLSFKGRGRDGTGRGPRWT